MTMAKEKAGLSNNVRQMKFMMRRNDGMNNETKTTETISIEHWHLNLPQLNKKENNCEISSLSEGINVRYGRMSFQGFNKATEKLMAILNPESDKESDMEEDTISDSEMTERFVTYVKKESNRNNKFTKLKHKLKNRESTNLPPKKFPKFEEMEK